MLNTNEEAYIHRHCTVINSPDDSLVVELSYKSHYREKQVAEILKEAEDKIKSLIQSEGRAYGHPKPYQ